MNRLIGVLLVIVSGTAYGTMPIFAKFAYRSGVTPVSLLFIRFLLAGLVMILWMLIRGIPFPRGKTLLGLFLTGAGIYAGQALTYFTALSLAPAATIAILLCLGPALTMILSVIFLRHPVTRVDLCALAFALIGTMLVIDPKDFAIGGHPLGIVFGLISVSINACYILVGTKIMRRTDAFSATAIVIASTSVTFGGMAAVQGMPLPATMTGWSCIIAIAFICTILAIMTFFEGLKRIGPVKAGMLATSEPVTAVIFACLILGEVLTTRKIIGGLMVLTTAILLARKEAMADK